MTLDEQRKLAVLAAQQAEDAFAQYGVHLDTNIFNAMCDYMAELTRRLVEDGPDARPIEAAPFKCECGAEYEEAVSVLVCQDNNHGVD